MNRLALWALYLFALTVPLENTIAIPGMGTSARIVGYAAFGLCIWSILLRGRVHRPDTLHLLWLAFVLLSTLSLMWTFDTESTIARIATYVQLLAMMWLIGEIATTRANQEMLMTWLVIGATISAFATLHAYSIGTTYNNDARYAAEGFDPNDMALTFAMMIPIAWYLGSKMQRPWARGFLRASIFLLLFGITLTGSRGGVLATAAALLIIPALSKRQNIGATALTIIGAAIALMAIVPAQSWDRLFSIRDEILTGTMTNRTEIWKMAFKKFVEHPIFGVGSGAFPRSVQHIEAGLPTVAHNTYVSILVELGTVGFVVFAGILALTCRRILSLPSMEKRLWAIALLTWCIGVFGLSWECKKMTWLLFAFVAAQVRAFQNVPSRGVQPGEELWQLENLLASGEDR